MLYLLGIVPKLVDPRKTTALRSRMEHLIQIQTLTSTMNSIVEASTTLQPLVVMMKRLQETEQALSCCEGKYSLKGEDGPQDVLPLQQFNQFFICVPKRHA
jgi:hypothetical protein